jgi:L-2-hydroxyglutarate oxidase
MAASMSDLLEKTGASGECDYCVIGGGIVGLATAMALQDHEPAARVVVLEKEPVLAVHQTGHNSGVIHAGIYYQPGSLKARLCREGAEATKSFCAANGVPFVTCGKLLVATSPLELERMVALEERARQNGIEYTRLSKDELREVEPDISGLAALLVPSTGIVDYKKVCTAMADIIRMRGGEIRTDARVSRITERATSVAIDVNGGEIRAGQLIACAGLQSDRVARMAGLDVDFQIVPFRGEYYTLPKSRAGVIKHLIYPIPDPDLPFLGIHLTRMFDGSVTVGPNAVLGFSREGYPKGSLRLADVLSMIGFKGFWKMVRRNWRSGIAEFRNSIFKTRYLQQCRKYCPDLKLADLGAPAAGIRAQAVMNDGSLVHDFLFRQSARTLHVCNAPSPAATSAIPIGRMIVERLFEGRAGGETIIKQELTK